MQNGIEHRGVIISMEFAQKLFIASVGITFCVMISLSFLSVKRELASFAHTLAAPPVTCENSSVYNQGSLTERSPAERSFTDYRGVTGRRYVVHVPPKIKTGDVGLYAPNYKNPCFYEGKAENAESLRCLPKFYLLGASKSGTSAFCRCLSYHDEIVQAEAKELDYWTPFEHTNHHLKQHYLPKFSRANHVIYNSSVEWAGHREYHHKVTYDCTPRNGWYIPGLPPRLRELYPETRLIFLLRHPTDRMFSQYHFECVRLKKPFSARTFHAEALKEIKALERCVAGNELLVRCCIQAGWTEVNLHFSIYYPYVRTWLEFFPPHQVLVIKAEDFYSSTLDVMDGVFRFLTLGPPDPEATAQILHQQRQYEIPGIKNKLDRDMPDLLDELRRYTGDTNRTAQVHQKARERWKDYENEILPETRTLLDDFFEPFNRKLASLLGDERFLFQREGS